MLSSTSWTGAPNGTSGIFKAPSGVPRRDAGHRLRGWRCDDAGGTQIPSVRGGVEFFTTSVQPSVGPVSLDLVILKFSLGPVALDVSLLSLSGVLIAYLIARSLF